MPTQSTTPPASICTLAAITRLSDRRAALWEQPYRTADDLAEIAHLDAQLAQLWDQRRLQQATERAAAHDAEEQEAAERRQAARTEARLIPARVVAISASELAQTPDLERRTPLSDEEVRAIRRAYAQRQHGDITRLAAHYGVSAATIRAIGQRVSRADVPDGGLRA